MQYKLSFDKELIQKNHKSFLSKRETVHNHLYFFRYKKGTSFYKSNTYKIQLI